MRKSLFKTHCRTLRAWKMVESHVQVCFQKRHLTCCFYIVIKFNFFFFPNAFLTWVKSSGCKCKILTLWCLRVIIQWTACLSVSKVEAKPPVRPSLSLIISHINCADRSHSHESESWLSSLWAVTSVQFWDHLLLWASFSCLLSLVN